MHTFAFQMPQQKFIYKQLLIIWGSEEGGRSHITQNYS
jgi:hypothetical protein